MTRQKFKHKFGAKRTSVKGIKFPSLLEARCYNVLNSMQESGKILFFLRQIPFDLPGNMKHFVDFLVFRENDILFIEAKGRDLAVGRNKRLQVEDLNNIDIHVVTNEKKILELIND